MTPKKILVVEDDLDWQARIRQHIEGLGYEAVLASSALEARTKIVVAPQDYALILLDPSLTEAGDDREGLLLLDQVRERGIQTPCVLLTGFLTKELAKDLINEYDVVAALEKADFYQRPAEVRNALHRAVRGARSNASKIEHPLHGAKETAPKEGTSQQEDVYERKGAKNTETPLEETYVDFELHVSPDGHARAHSDVGDRTASISIVIPDDVQLALGLIEENRTNEKLLRDLGKRLYEIIFPSRIDTHLSQTESVARIKRHKVRIRLTVEPDVLARVPWEFTYRQEGGYYLAVNPRTVLSRYLNLPLPQDRVRPREGPLHMLIIISNPSDQAQLDPDEWDEIITATLSAPLKEGAITARMVKQATYEEIRNALHAGKPDIVQFVGHGIYSNDKGYLALVDGETGGSWIVDDERFANIFLGFDDHLRLVCLATCESAKSDSPQGFLGIAPQIVARGTPAVVAMQYRVLVSTAKIFLENFYTAVAARKPIDWAVQQARNAVSIKLGLDNREFAAPVLYMRAEDGNIF